MNHVLTIASRPVGTCLKSSAWSRDASALRSAVSLLLRNHHFSSCAPIDRTTAKPWNKSRPSDSTWKSSLTNSSCGSKRYLHQSSILRKLKPYTGPKGEEGLRFRKGELSKEELEDIFLEGCPPPAFANRLLRILHGRRVDGTLDLPPPEDIERGLEGYPEAVSEALGWLDHYYPVDEDEAIAARIRREEAPVVQENPAALMQRAEDLGLYKPQSGNYQAELSGKEGDVFGRSRLDELRAENIAKAAKEEERLEKQIEQIRGDAKKQQDASMALTRQPESGLEVAQKVIPQPTELDKWRLRKRNEATSSLTLDSPEVANITAMQRLLPSFVFAVIVSGLSYFFAQYWVPPKRSDRIMHDASLSFATVAGIFAANLAIYFLWRRPSFWRLLNRYFIIVPGLPKAPSMLGAVFSHQKIVHLLQNSMWMVLLGLSFHEDVGRGTFLAVYLASGAMGSFASLANAVAKGLLHSTVLGSSAAVCGIITAYFTIHANENFRLLGSVLPPDWQAWLSADGWVLLTAVLLWQISGYMRPVVVTEYVGHLAGCAVGIVSGFWWRSHQDEEVLKQKTKDRRPTTWFEKLIGKGDAG